MDYSLQSDYFKKSEQQEADEVKKNHLKDREVKGEKDCHDGKNKKGFVVNRRKKPLGKKHEDDDGQKDALVKPPNAPAKISS